MKSLSMVLFSLFSLLGCSQNQQNMDSINSSNFVEKVVAEVKHYDAEPMYWLNIEKQAQIEIYVNDMPVYKDFSNEDYGKSEPINHMILRSGEQRVKYRVYSENPEVYIELEVYTLDKADKNKAAKTLTTYEKTIKMPSSGVYEDEFVFTANVPYEINTLDTAKDLSKLDKEELEKKALEWNKMVQKIYETKDKDALARIYFEQEKRNSIASYKTPEDNKELWDEYLDVLERKNRMYKEMKSYKMSYFSNNRLVSLLHSTPDIRYVNGGILTYSYTDEDGDEQYEMNRFYLYMPKDSEDLFPF